jgi:hypothetical protein
MSLFSFQGTGHAVWRRGLRILPERQSAVKEKVNETLTFLAPAAVRKEHPGAPPGSANVPAPDSRVKGRAFGRGSFFERTTEAEEAPGTRNIRPEPMPVKGFAQTSVHEIHRNDTDATVPGEPSQPPQSSHLP